MSFQEECRRAEDKNEASKPKTERDKIRTALPTITPYMTTEFSRAVKVSTETYKELNG